ncbi:MAG: 50S ribosomal protein L23 [Candidatus Micrarchaeaceae archaeon]
MNALLYPVATEKVLGAVDRDNTIVYVVDMRAGKKQIKEEFEKTFGVKVDRINTSVTIKNTKKAYIKINKAAKASDIARKLKLV